jgi:hypothetical protein
MATRARSADRARGDLAHAAPQISSTTSYGTDANTRQPTGRQRSCGSAAKGPFGAAVNAQRASTSARTSESKQGTQAKLAGMGLAFPV